MIADLKTPDGDGFDLIRLARKQSPEMEKLVISVLGDEESVVTAISTSVALSIIRVVRQVDAQDATEKVLNALARSTSSEGRQGLHRQGRGPETRNLQQRGP